VKADIGSESRFLPTPFAFDAPVRGESRQNVAMPFGVEKLEWLPDGEKISKICLFVFTECTNVINRQTHRHTDRHRMTAKAALDAGIARQKLNKYEIILTKRQLA